MTEQTTSLARLMEAAAALAVSQGHIELDPGHVLVAVADRGYPLSPDLLEAVHFDRDAVLADLRRRLPSSPTAPDPLPEGQALRHARIVAESMAGTAPLTPEDLVAAVWNVAGPTARFTQRGRWLATAELNEALGRASRSDHLRVRLRRWRAQVNEWGRGLAQSSVGRPLVVAGSALLRTFRWFTEAFGAVLNYGALFLLWPGLVTREGSRAMSARLLGSRRRSPKFVPSLGAEYYLEPVPSPARTATILLGPHLLTFAIGITLILETLVDSRTTGRNPLPAFTSRGTEIVGASETEILADFIVRSPASMWFGLACLFVALPPYATVRQARAELAACGLAGRVARVALVPLAVLAACLAPIEWIMSRFGLNAIFGVGLLSLFGGVWLAAMLVDGVVL